MKKLFTLMFALFAVSMASFAAQPTDAQVEQFKQSCMNYMRNEGYAPSIDDDGDIKFRSEGDLFWVQVESYSEGYYVTVMTVDSVDSDEINQVRRIMDKVTRGLKYVRLYTTSSLSTVVTEYSWYCLSLSDFKVMFPKALLVVQTAERRFLDEYK